MPVDENVTRLEDLEVKEVSVVDRGANKRGLLVVKNTSGDPMPKDAFEQAISDAQTGKETPADDLSLKDDGTSVEQAEKPADGDAKKPPFPPKGKKEKGDDSAPDPVVEAQAAKAAEDTELIVGMDEATKTSYVETLKAMATRISALGEAVAAAKSDSGATTSEKLLGEIVSVSQGLGRLAATDKAEVITALAKGLLAEPQAAQVAMASMPMEMTATGPMFKVPVEMALPMMAEFARKQLYQAEDMLYGPEYDMGKVMMILMGVMKVLGPFIPDAGGMPMQTEMAEIFQQYAFNQPQKSIPAGVPDAQLPEGMEKSGRKISGANMGTLEEMFEKLGNMISDAKTKDSSTEPVTKAESPEIARLTGQVEKLTKLAKAQHTQLASMKSERPTGHATSIGDTNIEDTETKQVTWPDDLNTLNDDPDLRF